MSKSFVLYSTFRPSRDQPGAIHRLEEKLEDGLTHQMLLGVTGSNKTLTIANMVADLQRLTIVLTPNEALTAWLYDETKKFFPENAVECLVSYYDYYRPGAYVPSPDTFIEKDVSVNERIE